MAVVKSLSSKGSISKIVNYVTNPKKTNEQLISGINCNPESVKDEMNYTKTYYRKKNETQYFHVIQSFKPGEVDPKKAHEIGREFANRIAPTYECLVVTHIDKEHIHNHLVINSVSYKNGKKFHVEKGAYSMKKESNKICERENLSLLDINRKSKDKAIGKVKGMTSNEYRAAINKNVTWWKGQVIIDIKQSQMKCKSKEEFINDMESKGYKVNWSDTRKHITYTTPDGKKVRDNKLHDETLLKEVMENGFKRITKEQYDRGTERNLSGITRAAEPGIIASTTNRAIEGSKQKSSGAENSISKPTGADIYTELSKQGTIQGDNNSSRENSGTSRANNEEPGRATEQLQKHSSRTNAADGQVYEVSSKGSTTRGLQESSQAREIETNTNGQSNNNNDRCISNSNNMLDNDNSNNLSKEIDKKKNLGLER